MEHFFPIAVLFFFALVICVSIFSLTHLLGPKNPVPSKLTPYECGVKPDGDARAPFRSSFYLVAVLFLLFDVEAAFFFPWALVFKESIAEGPGLLVAMLVYLAFMVLGLVYILRKDGLGLNRA